MNRSPWRDGAWWPNLPKRSLASRSRPKACQYVICRRPNISGINRFQSHSTTTPKTKANRAAIIIPRKVNARTRIIFRPIFPFRTPSDRFSSLIRYYLLILWLEFSERLPNFGDGAGFPRKKSPHRYPPFFGQLPKSPSLHLGFDDHSPLLFGEIVDSLGDIPSQFGQGDFLFKIWCALLKGILEGPFVLILVRLLKRNEVLRLRR